MENRISITVSADGLSATLDVTTGEALAEATLALALKNARVTTGIHEDRAADLAQRLHDPCFTCTGEQIATGRDAENGSDGHLELHTRHGILSGSPRADRSLDYRERGLVTNVNAGETVARYTPATSGVHGIKVSGQRIPAIRGKECRPDAGPGIRFEDDEALARRSGVLTFIPGSLLDVNDLYCHKGDVDYASGNLDVEGALQISGSVLPNFQALATRDIQIGGGLDRCTVHAGGNLLVSGGITGTAAGDIQAAGNIGCRFTNSTSVRAGGRLELHDHSVNSDLRAHHIRCVDGRGHIAGGRARAEAGIHLRRGGTTAETTMHLEVAKPMDELTKLRDCKLAEQRQRRQTVKRANRLRTGRRAKGGKESREATRLATEIRTRQRLVRQRETELLRTAEILVTETLHPGVNLRFGPLEHQILEPTGPTRFVVDPESNQITQQKVSR